MTNIAATQSWAPDFAAKGKMEKGKGYPTLTISDHFLRSSLMSGVFGLRSEVFGLTVLITAILKK